MHITKEHINITIIQTKQRDLVNHSLVELAGGEAVGCVDCL
jgi:hypothetical protein